MSGSDRGPALFSAKISNPPQLFENLNYSKFSVTTLKIKYHSNLFVIFRCIILSWKLISK